MNTDSKPCGCQRTDNGGMGKLGKEEWEVQASGSRMNKSTGMKGTAQAIEAMVSSQRCMATDGSCTCGGHGMKYRAVETTCCTPEIDVTLWANYAHIYQ